MPGGPTPSPQDITLIQAQANQVGAKDRLQKFVAVGALPQDYTPDEAAAATHYWATKIRNLPDNVGQQFANEARSATVGPSQWTTGEHELEKNKRAFPVLGNVYSAASDLQGSALSTLSNASAGLMGVLGNEKGRQSALNYAHNLEETDAGQKQPLTIAGVNIPRAIGGMAGYATPISAAFLASGQGAESSLEHGKDRGQAAFGGATNAALTAASFGIGSQLGAALPGAATRLGNAVRGTAIGAAEGTGFGVAPIASSALVGDERGVDEGVSGLPANIVGAAGIRGILGAFQPGAPRAGPQATPAEDIVSQQTPRTPVMETVPEKIIKDGKEVLTGRMITRQKMDPASGLPMFNEGLSKSIFDQPTGKGLPDVAQVPRTADPTTGLAMPAGPYVDMPTGKGLPPIARIAGTIDPTGTTVAPPEIGSPLLERVGSSGHLVTEHPADLPPVKPGAVDDLAARLEKEKQDELEAQNVQRDEATPSPAVVNTEPTPAPVRAPAVATVAPQPPVAAAKVAEPVASPVVPAKRVSETEPGAPKTTVLGTDAKGRQLTTDGLRMYFDGQDVGDMSRARAASLMKQTGIIAHPVGELRPQKEIPVEKPSLSEGESKPIKSAEAPIPGEGKLRGPETNYQAGLSPQQVSDVLTKVKNIFTLGRNKDMLRIYEQMNRNLEASKSEVRKAAKNPADFRKAQDNLSAQLADQLDKAATALDTRGQKELATKMRDEANTVRTNLGTYQHTAYRIHREGDKWTKQLEGTPRWDIAVKEEMASKGVAEDVAKENLRTYLNDIAAEVDQGKAQVGSKTLNGGMFVAKQPLSPAFRELLGEYKDPTQARGMSLAKTSYLLETLRAQNKLAEVGEKLGIFKPAGSEMGLQPIGESYGAGPLAGFYADPATVKYVQGVSKGAENGALKMYSELNTFGKMMVTAGNFPVGMIRNFGNGTIAMWNGHMSPSSISDGLKLIKQSFSDPVLKADLTKRGIFGEGMGGAEMKALLRDLEGIDGSAQFTEKVNNWYRKTQHVAMRTYALPDDLFKAIGYASELKRAEGRGLTGDAAKDWAAENVSNLYPTWSRLPEMLKEARRNPFSGQFFGFLSEIPRNAAHTLNMAADSIRSGNKSEAFGRIAPLIATITTVAAVPSIMNARNGITPEQDKALRKAYLKDYNRNNYGYWEKVDGKQPEFHDWNWANPLGWFAQMAKSREQGDAASQTVMQAIEPWIGWSRATTPIAEAITGVDRNDKKLYGVDDTDMQKIVKGTGHVASELATPPTLRKVPSVMRGERPASDLINPTTITRPDLRKSVGGKVQEAREAGKQASSDVYSGTHGEPLTAEQAAAASTAEGIPQAKIKTLMDTLEQAGVPREKIAEALQEAGVKGTEYIGAQQGTGGRDPAIIQVESRLTSLDKKYLDALDIAQQFKQMPPGRAKADYISQFRNEVRQGSRYAQEYAIVKNILAKAQQMPAASRGNALAAASRLIDQIAKGQPALSPSAGSQP